MSEHWLPVGFEHPPRVEVAFGHHLRPIRPDDVELDVVAVTGSWERLWRTYGAASGWPPADLTTEAHRAELARRSAAAEHGAAYCYALLDTDETALLGHVVIGPPRSADADAEVSWWVVDECVGTELARALDELVPRWIGSAWPFTRPRLDVSGLPSAFSAPPQGRDASSKT